MGIFGMMDKSASGLSAERLRMDVISENIANANTTVTKNGGPYRRKSVVFEERKKVNKFRVPMVDNTQKSLGNGVRVSKIVEDKSPFKYMYDPNHPNANKEGYVAMPNVNTVKEMTDMISATRSYEANVTTINAAKGMANTALNIGK